MPQGSGQATVGLLAQEWRRSSLIMPCTEVCTHLLLMRNMLLHDQPDRSRRSFRHTLRCVRTGGFAQGGGYGQVPAQCSGYGQVSAAPSQLPADAGAPVSEGMYGSDGYPYAQTGMNPMYNPMNQMLYSQGGQGGPDPNIYYAQMVHLRHCMQA